MCYFQENFVCYILWSFKVNLELLAHKKVNPIILIIIDVTLKATLLCPLYFVIYPPFSSCA
jgi:hypothetical protein